MDYQSAQSLLGIDQNGWILPEDLSSSFSVLTTLLLLNYKLPLLSWSLRALMTLHLFWVTILRDKALSFPNLNNFILSGLIGMWYDTEVFGITCPNLTYLIISDDYTRSVTCKFVVSVPTNLF